MHTQQRKAGKKANTAACTHKSIDPTEAPAPKIISSRTFPGKTTLAQLHYFFSKKPKQNQKKNPHHHHNNEKT